LSLDTLLIYAAIALSMVSIIISILNYRSIRLIKYMLRSVRFRRMEVESEWGRRIRKRYVVFTILSDKSLSKRDVESVITRVFKDFYGSDILVKADPQLVYYEPRLMRGVIRVNGLYKDQLISVLGFIRDVNGVKCLFIPVKTTGTIRKARRIMERLEKD